jgi:8-hydroxy-5-deazaflavin:NADPH oxidoreductase
LLDRVLPESWETQVGTSAHMDPKPDISLAGVTRSRAALKGRTSSEMVAEMAVGARLVKSISNRISVM